MAAPASPSNSTAVAFCRTWEPENARSGFELLWAVLREVHQRQPLTVAELGGTAAVVAILVVAIPLLIVACCIRRRACCVCTTQHMPVVDSVAMNDEMRVTLDDSSSQEESNSEKTALRINPLPLYKVVQSPRKRDRFESIDLATTPRKVETVVRPWTPRSGKPPS